MAEMRACTHTQAHAHTHTHTEAMVWFFCETSLPFCFVLPGSKSPLVYIIFLMPTQSLQSYLPPTCCTLTCLLSSMPLTQLMQYFGWRNICILFTLGKRCIFCYVTHATYVAFLLGHLHPVYFRKQVHILLCYPYNLCGMSKESSSRYPTLKAVGGIYRVPSQYKSFPKAIDINYPNLSLNSNNSFSELLTIRPHTSSNWFELKS